MFSDLSEQQRENLARHRVLVSAAVADNGVWPPASVEDGARLLQCLIDEKAFSSRTGLIALGVGFGDLLCMLGPLRWVHANHPDGGQGVVLQWKDTSVSVFAPYVILKRVEAGDPVDIRPMLDAFMSLCEEAELEARG